MFCAAPGFDGPNVKTFYVLFGVGCGAERSTCCVRYHCCAALFPCSHDMRCAGVCPLLVFGARACCRYLGQLDVHLTGLSLKIISFSWNRSEFLSEFVFKRYELKRFFTDRGAGVRAEGAAKGVLRERAWLGASEPRSGGEGSDTRRGQPRVLRERQPRPRGERGPGGGVVGSVAG